MILIVIIFILTVWYLLNYVVNKVIFLSLFEPLKRDNDSRDKLKQYMFKLVKNRSNSKLKIKDIMLKTKDNCLINCHVIENKSTNKWIIYCHGNSGDIYNPYKYLVDLVKTASIVVFDYRGYGLSTCSPSPLGLTEDLLTVWRYLTNNMNIKPKNITLYGYSMGAAVVLKTARILSSNPKRNEVPNGLIIESGFSSLKNLAKFRYPLLNFLNYFYEDQFNSVKYISQIGDDIPILIAHSKEDELIPYKHGRLLFKHGHNVYFNILSGLHGSHRMNKQYLNKIKNIINRE